MENKRDMPYKSRPPELMDKLTLEEIKLVDRLFETAFKGYAQARIAKLKPHILDALVTMCTSPKDAPVAPNASTEDKVSRVLGLGEKSSRRGARPASRGTRSRRRCRRL